MLTATSVFLLAACDTDPDSTGGTAGGSGGASGPALEDPAPFADDPGETKSCPDAPYTDVMVFEYTDIATTTMTFSGRVTGPSADPFRRRAAARSA